MIAIPLACLLKSGPPQNSFLDDRADNAALGLGHRVRNKPPFFTMALIQKQHSALSSQGTSISDVSL